MRCLNSFLFTLYMLCLLCFIWLPPSYGKSFILPPDKMLAEADVIFTGHIINFKKITTEDEPGQLTRLVKIKVDKILKGNLDTDTVTLKEYQIIAAITQKFPTEKVKLFVLQRKQSDGSINYVADTYNIGIMQNDAVVDVIEESPPNRDYAKAYNDYYQNNKDYAVVPPRSTWNPWNAALIVIGCVAVIMRLILMKRKREG